MLIAITNTVSDYLSFLVGEINPEKTKQYSVLGTTSHWLKSKRHSEIFFKVYNQLISQIEVESLSLNNEKNGQSSSCQIDLFVALSGPGSFTGIRVGTSAFMGLARSYNKPFVTLSNLEVKAYEISRYISEGLILSVLPANRNEYYWALFEKKDTQSHQNSNNFNQLKRIYDDQVSAPDEIKKILTGHNKTIYGIDFEDLTLGGEKMSNSLLLRESAPLNLETALPLSYIKYKQRLQEGVTGSSSFDINYIKRSEAERIREKRDNDG